MSVFGDFQRLWMQRFPHSSLSDAWEMDVRASLERHKQKIVELTKELEQETLYVEYLERLLSDVEKCKDDGSDPTTLFEAATATASSTNSTQSHQQAAASLIEMPLSLNGAGESSALSDNKDENNVKFRKTSSVSNSPNSSEHRESNKFTDFHPPNGVTANNPIDDHEKEDKDAITEKDLNLKNGAALQQCITELASGFKSRQMEDGKTEAVIGESKPEKTPLSHFVTVIEVKEMKVEPTPSEIVGKTTTTTTIDLVESSAISSSSSTTTTVPLIKEVPEVVPVSYKSVTSSGENYTERLDRDRHSSESEIVRTSFERKPKCEPSAPPMSPSMSSSTSATMTSSSFLPSANLPTSAIGFLSASAMAANLEAKKKVPPRPPPKLIRRVEPPTVPGGNIPLSSSPKRDLACSTSNGNSGSSSNDSPSSSLERNIKPSEILRQKTTETSTSSDAKNFISNRKTTPDIGKFGKSSDLAEELGRKIVKSESLEKTKRAEGLMKVNQSPTGSLGKTTATVAVTATASPTGSLSKFSSNNVRQGIESPPTGGSLEKNKSSAGRENTLNSTGSRESIASQGNVSEFIKSYESISSLSSDSTKAGQNIDNEPYYDTVPVDNGDGEYVYIKPGGTGSTSSRDDLSTAESTLPILAASHHSSSNRSHISSHTSDLEPESPGRNHNYTNIDYFLHQRNNENRSSSMDSDGELDAPPIMRTISHDETTSQTPGALRKSLLSAILMSGNLRGSKIRPILNSIIQSESSYVECLNKMIQYKKAIHGTLGTSQPVIREDEENAIFFRIEELHAAHTDFLNDLKSKALQEVGDILVGDAFKRLADIIDLYSSFLHNYGQAIDTVKKCSESSKTFKDTVSAIVLKLQNEQSLTLEDLLHKPVARVQINALVFHDLLNVTPPNHPDYQTLRQSQKTIHNFLKQFNVVNQRLPTESNKNLRRMVKNSFIVELVDGHRKLRHLFLFNDAIGCAKYKASGRDRFELELKWFMPLKDIIMPDDDSAADLKESSPMNILQLKSQACTVRDQILMEERDDKKAKANGVRVGDKHRRKLADLEALLVLASPNLVFKIGNRATNKCITFFLSSDFERTQWIDSIYSLQQSCNIPGIHAANALDIQAFILAMQNRIKTEMGSYLMRNRNDESLLVGDLHLTVQGLTGLDHPADMYICIEVDSYGHYFRKAKTKMVCRSTSPLWNESFVLELEGSQNVRILLYEACDRPVLRAKHIMKLSRGWLQEAPISKPIKLSESIILNTAIRFVPGEVTLRRVPTSKPGALFGAKMSQVLKREKRDIPFIISACIREVERRGMAEVGIYRVSGSASDLAKLKKSFETNAYEAEQLLKEVDIHSVTGILKSYLRELPEALFTDLLYPKLFETFNQFSTISESARIQALMAVFEELQQTNKASILHILDHLIRVHQQESDNKMSLHNLAMVFGPTLLRPGQTQTKQKDLLASSTVDVMAQAGILYCFLQARIKKD